MFEKIKREIIGKPTTYARTKREVDKLFRDFSIREIDISDAYYTIIVEKKEK